MIIIADGGSTKTNWCLITESYKKIYFNTIGYNPYFMSSDEIYQSMNNNISINYYDRFKITKVYYYGAGANFNVQKNILKAAIQNYFSKSEVYIDHDLLGASYALLGTKLGFVAILGTGTNTCIYDGNNIKFNIDSLGYFFGDEGSGSYIGKKVLRDYMRNLMPKELSNIFYQTYKLNNNDILEILFKKKMSNLFLSQFSKFLYDNNCDIKYTENLVETSFIDFFDNIVSKYYNYSNYKFNCVGSVGYSFRKILSKVSLKYNMQVNKIIKSPINNLVDYHIKRIFK